MEKKSGFKDTFFNMIAHVQDAEKYGEKHGSLWARCANRTQRSSTELSF